MYTYIHVRFFPLPFIGTMLSRYIFMEIFTTPAAILVLCSPSFPAAAPNLIVTGSLAFSNR